MVTVRAGARVIRVPAFTAFAGCTMLPPDWPPSSVWVINLPRRPERLWRFKRDFPADWDGPEPRVFAAIDGRNVTPPDWYHGPRGAWGCLRSHVCVWEQALSRGDSSVMIFEDDAIFAKDFTWLLSAFLREVPHDWHQIYLGGQHLHQRAHPPEWISLNVLRCHEVNRTHCYVMRRAMVETAYHKLVGTFDTEQRQHQHVDWRLGEMHLSGEWNIYAPRYWLVGQREGPSDVGRPTREVWFNRFRVVDRRPEKEREHAQCA